MNIVHAQLVYHRSRGRRVAAVFVPAARWDRELCSARGEAPGDVTAVAGADLVVLATWPPAAEMPAADAGFIEGAAQTARGVDMPSAVAELVREAATGVVIEANRCVSVPFAVRLRSLARRAGRPARIVLHTHDILSQWARPDRAAGALAQERALLRPCDAFVHLSDSDAAHFRREQPDRPHALAFPPMMSAPASAPEDDRVRDLDALFVGSGHPWNIDAVRWLLESIWPTLADRGHSLAIVGTIGRNFAEAHPELYARWRGAFAGWADDLAAWYRRARCAVVPMRRGTGIAIKTVEAMAHGVPVVGTTVAFRGFPAQELRRLGVVPHDDAAGLAGALSAGFGGAGPPGAAFRALYERLCARERYAAAVDGLLARIFADPGGG